MITKTAQELESLVCEVLVAAGADQTNAAVVADHLVMANLSGVDTHGVWHLLGYVEAIQAGELAPAAKPDVLEDTAGSVRIRGNWTFGQVVAKQGMKTAIDKASKNGVAVVGLVQLNHIGRLGHYVEMAAAAGMIGMVFGGGYGEEEPATMPYGGREAVLHTNPIAMSFPAASGAPMMFDWATTSLSGVRVVNARRRGEALPEGAVVDGDGVPTTDPEDFFAGGGHLPFGGHKGYSLMMAAEYLGRIFTAADEFAGSDGAGPVMRHQGVCLMAMRADLFQPAADFGARSQEMQRRVRAVPPAPGFSEVLAPGDLESRSRDQRRQSIPIDDEVWQSILRAAELVAVGI